MSDAVNLPACLAHTGFILPKKHVIRYVQSKIFPFMYFHNRQIAYDNKSLTEKYRMNMTQEGNIVS